MRPNTVQTWAEHPINDGINYRASILNAGLLPAAKNTWIEQAQADAQDSGGFTTALRTPLVIVQILNYANRYALEEQLKQWFKGGTRGTLVTKFKDDGLDYQLNCASVNIVQNAEFPAYWVGQLESGDTHWRAVSPDTDTWHVTGTGGTKAITVLGGDETRLSAALTSTTGATIGFPYQNIYELTGVAGINFGVRAWCLTINSAALVTAGKLQADMDDFRIIVDGREVKRWIANPNTTATNIWFTLPIGRGETLTLQTPIAVSGTIPIMQFNVTQSNKDAISRMPNKGIVKHGTEWIAYTGRNIALCQLKTPQRARLGTAMQSHTLNDVFTFLEHTIIVKYGNSTVSAPSASDPNYDIDKPAFHLETSDNTKWIWTASDKFYDPAYPNRPGSWTPVLEKLGNVSKYYWIKEDLESGDPAIGGKLSVFILVGLPVSEVGKAGFLLKCPAGFSEATITGRKYRSTVRWPAFAGLKRSDDNVTFYNVFNEAAPALAGVWAAITNTSPISIANTAKYIFFGLEGTILRLANAYAMLEALTGTIKFYSTNLPTGTFRGETGSFTLNLTLENQLTENKMMLDYPMVLNKVFDIDGENYEITFDSINMSDAMRLDDEGRSQWIRLLPGENILKITSPDVGTLDIVLSWYRRRL